MIAYTADGVKSILSMYREAEREIEDEYERLEDTNSKLYGIGGNVLSDMPKSPSPEVDKFTRKIVLRDEIISSIKELEESQKKRRRIIEKVLTKLRRSDEKSIMRMRYINNAAWKDVTFMMYGKNMDFIDREDVYLNRAHKIHGYALKEISTLLNESEEDNMAFSTIENL